MIMFSADECLYYYLAILLPETVTTKIYPCV